MFSRVGKQGLLALGRANDKTRCSGSEKNALLVVLVGIKKETSNEHGREKTSNNE